MSGTRTLQPGRAGASWRKAAALCLALCWAVQLCAPACAASADRELVFGMSAAFSGPARGLGVEYHRGLMAAFAHVNAQGGAGGWRLSLSLRDDGYVPAAALDNSIFFVEEQRVFALLGYVGTPTTARVLPLLKRYESLDLSLLFPLTGADMLRERPHDIDVFNLRASYLDETRALVEALLAIGKRRIAVFHQVDVYGRNGWDGVRRTLGAHDLTIVSEATYNRGARFARDFRREVDIIQAGRPDAIITVGTAPACAAFIRDAKDAGATALLATLSFADSDNLVRYLLGQAKVSGRDYTRELVFSQVVPCYEDLRLPAVRLYRGVMDQTKVVLPAGLMREEYTPQRYSFVSFEGFLAGLVLAEAVKRMADAPSRGRLRAVLASLHGLDLGLGEKVDFRPGGNQGLRRTYLTVYRHGRFEGIADLRGATP